MQAISTKLQSAVWSRGNAIPPNGLGSNCLWTSKIIQNLVLPDAVPGVKNAPEDF